MNQQRRKQLEVLKVCVEGKLGTLSEIQEGIQETFDNMTDTQQESARGEALSEEIDALQTLYDTLEDAVSQLEELINAN